MNRYRTAPGLGPSKASGTTICQKCLQKGHYSYECKSALQSRPYVSRASRTQQLRNPKLKPRLTETKLEESEKQRDQPKGETSGIAGKQETADGRVDNEDEHRPVKRQRRSHSVSSVDSISTISTNASDAKPTEKQSRSQEASTSEPRSTDTRPRPSVESPRSPDGRSKSPPVRRWDRSPYRSRRNETSPDGRRNPDQDNSAPRSRRERSLSPYSRRLALTQSMNMR